jgi:hypothetical protein
VGRERADEGFDDGQHGPDDDVTAWDRLPLRESVGDLLGGGGTAPWERWVSEVRVDDAVRRRSSERWLRQQAGEEGCLAGVLVDLCELRTWVVLHTRTGRVHRGTITQVGEDFVRLVVPSAGEVLVGFEAISSVRTAPGDPVVTGDRTVVSRTTLAEVITGLTAERERAVIVPLDGSEPVCGVVTTVGRDIVVVQVGGDGPGRSGTAYVPLAAVGEVVPGV